MKCPVKFKHGSVPDRMFNVTQLATGTKIEREHTNNPCIAKQIAKAPLTENKNYYKLLKKVKL
jgi:hypothetical protein